MSDYRVSVDINTQSQSVNRAREELTRMNQQIRQAGTQSRQAGVSMDQAFSGGARSALLLARNLLGAVGAAASLAGVIRGVRSELVQINRLNEISLFTGIDPLGLGTLQARATAVGVSLETLNSSIQRQERALENAQEGYTRYIRFFDDLNLNVSELQSLRPEERFQAITDALAQGAREGRNVANAVRALAGSDPQILKLAGSTSELAAQLARVRLVGAEADQQLLAQAGRLDDAVNQVSLGFQGLRQNILRALGDEIVASTEGFAGFIENLSRTVEAVRVLQEQQRQLEETSQRREQAQQRRESNRERFPGLARLRDQFPDVRIGQDALDLQVEAFPLQIAEQINNAVVEALAQEFREFPIDLDAVGSVQLEITNPERIAQALGDEDLLGELIEEITELGIQRARAIASAIEQADRVGGNISNEFLDRLTNVTFSSGDVRVGFAGELTEQLAGRVAAIREAADQAVQAEQEAASAFRQTALERTEVARIYQSTSNEIERALLLEIQTIRSRAQAESLSLSEALSGLAENVRNRQDVEQAYRDAQVALAEQASIRIAQAEQRALDRRREALENQLQEERDLRQANAEALLAQLAPLDNLFDELEDAQRIREAIETGQIQSQEQLNRLREDERRLQSVILDLKAAGADIDEARIRQIIEEIRLEREKAELIFRQQRQLERFIDSTVSGVGDVLANSIVDGLNEGRFAFRDFVNDIANTLIRSGIRELVAQIFSPQGNATQSIAASFIGGLFGGSTQAGTAAGGPDEFAQGGVVNMPTRFMSRGGAGLMGEAGPEAILPLQRLPNGDLGVAAQGGGGTVNVNTTINVTGDNGDPRRTADLAARSVERVVTSKVYEILARESRAGNLLSRPVPRF